MNISIWMIKLQKKFFCRRTRKNARKYVCLFVGKLGGNMNNKYDVAYFLGVLTISVTVGLILYFLG